MECNKELMKIGKARINYYDSLNVTVEVYETYWTPKKQKSGWRRKGYYGSIAKALKSIGTREYLIDKKAVSSINDYLIKVRESNDKLIRAAERLERGRVG